MPFEIKFLEEDRIIEIENKGELVYDDLVKQTQEAIGLARGNNSKLFLSIFSHVNVQANAFEVFQFTELYEHLGMDKESKIAVVVSNIELNTKELRFYETVCLNRGWQIRIFLQKDLAIEWLAEK